MNEKLLLDEHCSDAIAARLRAAGHDVLAVVADPELRAKSDSEVFRRAAASNRRIVTENIKDFRPLVRQAYATGDSVVRLLLVSPGRFPLGAGRRSTAIVAALGEWCSASLDATRPEEDWLV